MKQETNEHIRALALSFDGVSEVDHWGRPAFRTKKRMFAVMRPDGLWLYLPDERKEFLFEADPKAFVKYLWGKHPELLVQPERVSKKELAALLQEAYDAARPSLKTGPAPRTSVAKRQG
ncbi:MAG: MmcQ/YjbR family DNA-binding protein [Alphaproteobacteria bacterium]|nr:MmcQ/YjbR family DNA-binding protein [Alphaproteobacteria bacterium]